MIPSYDNKYEQEQDYNPHFEQISPTPNEETDEPQVAKGRLLQEVEDKESQIVILQAKLDNLYHRKVSHYFLLFIALLSF